MIVYLIFQESYFPHKKKTLYKFSFKDLYSNNIYI